MIYRLPPVDIEEGKIRKLKSKLAEEGLTLTDWVLFEIEEYIQGNK